MPRSGKIRITKDPSERKLELIQTAQQLFLTKGYEKTAVSDIVKTLDVAQGTFYYHFKSKAEMLEAVVERVNAALERDMLNIVHQNNTDAAVQLNGLINQLLNMRRTNRDLLKVIHQPGNVVLHNRLMLMLSSMMVPLLEEVITRGNDQGSFTVPFPQEAALVLMGGLDYLLHTPEEECDPQCAERVRATINHLLTRMLGTDGYAFNLEL